MNSAALLQQQQAGAAKPPKPSPEKFWTAQQIASCTGSPNSVQAIETNWLLIANACRARGIFNRENAAAIAATVAIESADTFQPVEEAFWLSREWRINNLRYQPFWGRGFIQLTWESNYRDAGNAIGLDLVNNPDRAMDPYQAALILAWFWDVHGIAQFATARNWRETRRRVQGADAGLSELIAHAECLLALP